MNECSLVFGLKCALHLSSSDRASRTNVDSLKLELIPKREELKLALHGNLFRSHEHSHLGFVLPIGVLGAQQTAHQLRADASYATRLRFEIDGQSICVVPNRHQKAVWHAHCQTYTAMLVGVVAPHDWIHVGPAEAKKASYLRHMLAPSTHLRAVRCPFHASAKKFEWIVQVVQQGHLQPATTEILQSVLGRHVLVDVH